MLVDIDHITELIPQRPPFVMIHTLSHHDGVKTATTFRVMAGNLFLQDGVLAPTALVENIAQTAAAAAGYQAKQSGEKVKIGFIGAIKNLQVFGEAREGDLLETETIQVQSVFNVSIVEGKVFCRGKLLASGEIKIFLQPES
ncbi:hypothetical protein FPE01S_01_11050 [Flavihumibacter petaseus NBRC 106054]|uniref:Uncharacterized protein n=2 Tax=Flavihumibacter TaxID=1004301 RepID=A0A0E9MWH3_9BACT|nr:hypothetical protein FPE01S_01_11050 [Flavihumibacter petaseus NBRC 106054]